VVGMKWNFQGRPLRVCVCVCVCVFEVDVSTEQMSTRACLQDSFKILSHCPGCKTGSNIVLGPKNLR
jgi:hypothetical protein